ncbi:hypothetical protein [Nocardia sp. NPDC055049]
MRNRIGATMRRWADRIDPDGAPRSIGWSFTFETGKGLVWRETRNQGCPVWVLGMRDYDRAHDEADSAAEEEAQQRRRALLHIAMTEPDPHVAGAAAAELRAGWTL